MSMDPTQIWTIIIVMAIGTFFIRWSFLGLLGDRDLPEWAIRHLRYTAVAVLPGLIAPFILWPTATDGAFDLARMLAAFAALLFGLWRRSAIAAILAGFATLYLVQFLT